MAIGFYPSSFLYSALVQSANLFTASCIVVLRVFLRDECQVVTEDVSSQFEFFFGAIIFSEFCNILDELQAVQELNT